MSRSLFQEGGPNKIRKTGEHQYTMEIPIPKDSEGRVGRRCPRPECSPGYFKVKLGTGITAGQQTAYCPYCRHEGAPSDFITKEQTRYTKDVMMKEVQKGVENMFKDALGIGPSGKRRLGSGMLSMELSYKPGPQSPIRPPFEDELQRIVVCPHCGLDHAVFGLAFWCSDCGRDIFMTHVEAEYKVVKAILSDIDRRRAELGVRIGARDLENCLEDVVSIYEASLKALLIRTLHNKCIADEEIQDILKKRVRNGFQNVNRSAEIVEKELGVPLFDPSTAGVQDGLSSTFEKRHPITHNLGVIDRKYIERVHTAELEGYEIRVTPEEVSAAIDNSLRVLNGLNIRLLYDDAHINIIQASKEAQILKAVIDRQVRFPAAIQP